MDPACTSLEMRGTPCKGSPSDLPPTAADAHPGAQPQWPMALLPNEPRVAFPALQAALTARYLLPALAEVHACMLAVRLQLDPVLAHQQPWKLGKPYPLGQCLEIAEAVEKLLRAVTVSSLPAQAAAGLKALRAFQRAGGAFRQVWGDLRGQYFQNAFQVGTLYIDVANDTVTPTKPKVEILPFDHAQFVPVRDFSQFRRLAGTYWEHEVFPNHVLPALAPHCPLVHVTASGVIQLHNATQYMLAMTRVQGFAPSEAVLREPPMPLALFERARAVLQDAGHRPAPSPEQGRRMALQQCRQQRARRVHQQPQRVFQIIQEVQQINRHLADRCAVSLPHSSTPRDPAVPSIKIDNIDYDLDSLSAEARTQLQSIQFVDQELARLQAHVAALQTARNAYVRALKAALPPVQG